METKLTLRLRKKIIDQAKDYAQAHSVSLSKLVETYLEAITRETQTTPEITPLVESLSGVIDLRSDADLKRDYTAFLAEKYQ